jgi:hypothetical protein
MNHFQAAINNFRKMIELTGLKSERAFLSRCLQELEEQQLPKLA